MQRINWIDWVKAFCMTVVVFCHLPQQGDTFYAQYLGAVILSSFFFISGYLKKPLATQKESLKKYDYSFLMHWITDICNRQKHGKTIMLIITIITMILYGANKYYHYAPYITFHGFVRCVCFFFMGNLFQQAGYLKSLNTKRDFTIGLSTLLLSIALFYWHIHEEHFILHIALYYIVNFLSVFGIIYLCRSLNSIRLDTITIISIGTMLIFGTHRILIGVIDFGFEKLLHISDVAYNWYEATLITIAIEIILIPFIIISKKRFPILLGKKSTP